MEFNSSSADSCSNTRRDNVWSEATSPESVETLLKSVGQEKMMPAASLILGTNVCKDESGSARHLESDIDLDTRNSDTMGPKNEFDEDPSQYKPPDKQLRLVEVSSLNSGKAGLSFENPHNLTHNTVSATRVITANEGEHDTEPADENVQEPKTIGCSKMLVLGASEALVQKNSDVSHIICNESRHESHASTRTGIEDTVVLEGNARKSITVAANLDCPNPKDSGGIPSNKECELLFPKGDEKTSSRASLQTDDLEIKTLATCSDIGSTLDEIHDGSVDGSNQHSAEPGYFAEHCTIPDGKRDSFIQVIPRPDNSMSEDGKLPVSPGNLDPRNVETLTTHLETQNVGEEEVIKGTDGLHNLRGQTYGMETETHASSNPDLLSSDVGNHQTREFERCVYAAAATHTQQVQYVAQCDVCVSLLQGTPPELVSMVLAFGPSDAGQIAWHSAWAIAVEKAAAAATEEEAVEAADEVIVEYLNRQITADHRRVTWMNGRRSYGNG